MIEIKFIMDEQMLTLIMTIVNCWRCESKLSKIDDSIKISLKSMCVSISFCWLDNFLCNFSIIRMKLPHNQMFWNHEICSMFMSNVLIVNFIRSMTFPCSSIDCTSETIRSQKAYVRYSKGNYCCFIRVICPGS